MKLIVLSLILPFAAAAARVEFAVQEEVEWADTEASTNVAVVADCERMREIAVRFAVGEGAASNCLQVAFGRDDNGDGELGLDEEETIYGWDNGRYFAESVPEIVRVEEPAPGATSCDFTVRMKLRKGGGLYRFDAVKESGAAVLTNLAAETHSWLYSPDWNIMRITRCGAGVPAEWLRCETTSHFMNVIVR
jgi:hypothetical protein